MSAGVIDLCSISSDEEEEEISSFPSKSRFRSHEWDFDDDDYDDNYDDDDHNGAQSATRIQTKKKNVVTPDEGTKNDGSENNTEQKKKPRSLFDVTNQPVAAKHAAKKRAPPVLSLCGDSSSSDEDDDDDSDDDPLLSFSSGLAKKKKIPEDTNNNKPIEETTTTVAVPAKTITNPYASANKKPAITTKPTTTTTSIAINNPYAKRTLPFSQNSGQKQEEEEEEEEGVSPSVVYPAVRNSTQYYDIRARFVLAFWTYSRGLVHASYNFNKLDQYCKRINALALSRFPVRSLEEYTQRGGGTQHHDAKYIQEALHAGGFDRYKTPSCHRDGRFYSIAEACLVSLLSHAESRAAAAKNENGEKGLDQMSERELQALLRENQSWVFCSDLLPMIDHRLKDVCPARLTKRDHDDNGASHYLDSSTRSSEFKQIEKLQTKPSGEDMPYIKRHRRNCRVCFELTLLGYETAVRIRRRTFPAPPGHYRTSNLREVEPHFEGIFLAVDSREGGGPKKKLHAMCNKLDKLRIPYFVGTFHIGDYYFFSGNNNNSNNNSDGSKLYPILVERKSIQDVAQSIFDGRWKDQKRRMYQGQYVFGYDNCRMAYIIEGTKQAQQLTGGYVAQRHFNVTREQLDKEIENLKEEGFDVLETKSRDHSLVELSRWATRVLQEYRDGKLTVQYTYEEFCQEVRKIPKSTDFSRIAKDKAQTKKNNNTCSQESECNKKRSLNPEDGTALSRKMNHDGAHQYKSWSIAQLQTRCVEWGLPKGGKKADLIERLLGPRPPKVWLQRKQKNLYVPTKHDTCATALLVALWLKQKDEDASDWPGVPKDELYTLAERLDISKDPFSGIGTGQYKYDGWNAMSPLRSGEVPLVVCRKGCYKLTSTSEWGGLRLAEAMHRWCHDHNKCSCRDLGYSYQPN